MIIQFSHNGKELNMTSKKSDKYRFESLSSGYRFWNNEPNHKRKFMKHKGWYLENIGNKFSIIPQQAELFFWGEWEPQSRFELTGNPYSAKGGLPHAIHYPLFSNNSLGIHNTDPFVFGESFYYTNCKQKRKGRGEEMLNLSRGSIILFGSEINKSEFIIDTVFVVSNNETVKDYKNHIDDYPYILRQVTIELKERELQDWHTLYKGQMYDLNSSYAKNIASTFCFFPCKVNCGNKGFERPIINWEDFNLQKPGAGTVLHTIKDIAEKEFWNKLVEVLLREGYSLGVQLDYPLLEEIIDISKSKKNSKNSCHVKKHECTTNS